MHLGRAKLETFDFLWGGRRGGTSMDWLII